MHLNSFMYNNLLKTAFYYYYYRYLRGRLLDVNGKSSDDSSPAYLLPFLPSHAFSYEIWQRCKLNSGGDRPHKVFLGLFLLFHSLFIVMVAFSSTVLLKKWWWWWWLWTSLVVEPFIMLSCVCKAVYPKTDDQRTRPQGLGAHHLLVPFARRRKFHALSHVTQHSSGNAALYRGIIQKISVKKVRISMDILWRVFHIFTVTFYIFKCYLYTCK